MEPGQIIKILGNFANVWDSKGPSFVRLILFNIDLSYLAR